MARASRTLCVELLAGADHLQGPTAAMVDVLQVLNTVARLRGAVRAPLSWQWCAADGRALRRAGSGGRRLRRPDLFVVPGWLARNGAHLSRLVERDRGAAARAQAVHRSGGQVLGLYTGVALLGQAGLLERRRAAVPWPFIPSVLRHAPNLLPAEGEAWVVQDGIWTADSPALATEMLLRALQAAGLEDLADAGRAVLLHTPERQRLVKAVARASTARVGPGTLERARRWLEDHWPDIGRSRNTIQLPSPIDSALRICASASGPRIRPTMTGAVGKSKRRITTPSSARPYMRNRSKALWRMPYTPPWRRSGCRHTAAASGSSAA
jgi:transcriptional regulator GlxA family with amidase domain